MKVVPPALTPPYPHPPKWLNETHACEGTKVRAQLKKSWATGGPKQMRGRRTGEDQAAGRLARGAPAGKRASREPEKIATWHQEKVLLQEEVLMGEAARRKRTDPTFGRVPKAIKDAKRGIVLCPPIEVNEQNTGFVIKNSGIDSQELRYSLLFWDELAWPTSNLIHIGGGPDEEFLQNAGILTRPRQTMIGSFTGADVFTGPHLEAFRQLDENEPGKWSLATGERSLDWKQMPLSAADAAVIELHRAIPVPDRDVPLSEILEFKQRRSDEIKSLRAEIDSYVLTIRTAGDPEAALAAKTESIEKACVDLLRAGNSWRFPVRLTDLKVTFETKPLDVIAKAIGGGAISSHFLNFGTVGTLLGSMVGASLAAGLKITGTPKLQGIRPRQTPYQYVYSFHNELF